MTAPVIRQFAGTIPDKGQAQTTFDTNVDAFLDWQALQFAPDLVAFGTFASDTAAALVAANLPSLAGRALDAVRVNAAADGVEFADVTAAGWALLDDADAAAQQVTLGVSPTPTGQVAWFAVDTAPAGTLKANGAAVSRTTYAVLFAVIGTTFGVGDGSTTFNVPDMRGEFARGWDDGRGIDGSRAFGSSQGDLFDSHVHIQGIPFSSDLSTLTRFGYSSGGSNLRTTQYGQPSSENDYPLTSSAGGSETRPRNIALLAVIFF